MINQLDIISILSMVCCWAIIGIIVVKKYRHQDKRPVLWKALLAVWIGLFSFSITLPFLQAQLAILPLGVWLLKLLMKKERWPVYRKYAWLGFFSNFIFLTGSLLQYPLYHWFYSSNHAKTFIAETAAAELVQTNITAQRAEIDNSKLDEAVKGMKSGSVTAIQW